MIKVFVDGQEGTTGLQIHERIANRSDIELLQIDPSLRKDTQERARLLNAADVAFLCLPDDAAKESVALVTNPKTIIIDPSTAHRTDSAWTYGLAELSKQHRDSIAKSKRISNPGCYATGFALAVSPLVQRGIISAHAELVCHAVSGYSGAGKKLIAVYEAPGAQSSTPGESPKLFAPRHYALALRHKHVPEMQKHAGLQHGPLFSPAVGPYYKGMTVNVSFFASQLTSPIDAETIRKALTEHYQGQRFVKVQSFEESSSLEGGFLDPTACNDTNNAHIHVFGHDRQIQISVVLDNLGKGASGAAVQNMNIALGLQEDLGL